MLKSSIKILLVRCLILMTGLIIAHLGVTLFLLADMGSDPFNVLIQGLHKALYSLTHLEILTHGRVHIGVCFLIILLLLVLDRSYIKIGTVLCMIFGGPIIDGFTLILGPLLSSFNSFTGRILMQVLGCVILSYGMTIVIKSEAGTGPNDLVSVVLSEKLKKKFSIIRILVDASFTVIGFFLGGLIGTGTIICVLCVGPVAGFFLPHNGKLIERVLAKTGCVK